MNDNISQRDYKCCDILYFSIRDNEEIKQLCEKGHRIFVFNINHIVFKEVNIVNSKYQIITLSYGLEDYMKNQIDSVIKENIIKDAVLIFEDKGWHIIVKYLKEKYNFKIIFNHVENIDLRKVNSEIIKISDKVLVRNKQEDIVVNELGNKISWIEKNIKFYDYIEKIIKEIHPLVSIIIITFNNINLTIGCIDSIISKTAYPNYELIIVDNNSQDGSKQYLIQLEGKYNNIKVLYNNKNYGFARANNIGIRYSKGEYLILLNNDTVVTKGWISGLIKHLDRDKSLGVVGPVTNCIANEAKIEVNYKDIENMDSFADEYSFSNLNKLYINLDMLAMFCVAMKKGIVNEVGYLDERFNIGTFEDDDYSLRVMKKGYKIACAEDVFIHHFGGATFSKFTDEEYLKIFLKNRKLFESKWNIKWNWNKKRKL